MGDRVGHQVTNDDNARHDSPPWSWTGVADAATPALGGELARRELARAAGGGRGPGDAAGGGPDRIRPDEPAPRGLRPGRRSVPGGAGGARRVPLDHRAEYLVDPAHQPRVEPDPGGAHV